METEFEKIVVDFFLPLRNKEGIDEGKYLLLCDALRKLSEEVSKSESIPKPLALLLIDIYPQMQSVASLYKGIEAEKLQDWAEDLMDLIYAVVT